MNWLDVVRITSDPHTPKLPTAPEIVFTIGVARENVGVSSLAFWAASLSIWSTVQSGWILRSAFAKPETLSEDDLKSLYADYVAKEKELFDEAQRSVRAGKETFGLTPSEIQSLFKDTSVEKDYRLPMTRGEFQPKTWYSDDFLILALAKTKVV